MSTTYTISNGLYSADHVEPLGIPTVARQLTAASTSANTTLTDSISRISIRARSCDIRYVVGVGTQTANASTSHFIANGERLDIAVPVGASIGVIRDSAATVNGSLAVTELT
jgi:hypothetical protein